MLRESFPSMLHNLWHIMIDGHTWENYGQIFTAFGVKNASHPTQNKNVPSWAVFTKSHACMALFQYKDNLSMRRDSYYKYNTTARPFVLRPYVEIYPNICPILTGFLYFYLSMGHFEITVVTNSSDLRNYHIKKTRPAWFYCMKTKHTSCDLTREITSQ